MKSKLTCVIPFLLAFASAQDNAECDFSSCVSCLEADCFWTASTCRPSCDIQDVACYGAGIRDVEAICEDAEQDEQDTETCSPASSCSECVDTVKSNGDSCMWFRYDDDESDGFCGTGCDIFGCGVTTCSDDGENCNFPDCTSCLESDCAWTDGDCRSSCEMQDVACFDTEMGTVEDVCDAAEEYEQDVETCGSASSCSECVDTFKDDESPCMWFTFDDGGGFCGPGCDMFGCGVTTCDDNGGSSCNFPDCTSCLESECVWTDGTCLSSCDIQDVACYQLINATDTAEEVCDLAEKEEEDALRCSEQTSCSSCVETTNSEGESCMWFSESDESGFCQFGCGAEGCGAMTCDEEVSECEDLPDCNSCLESDCVWTASMCLPSCEISDIACYEVRDEDETAEDVCSRAQQDEDDEELCGSMDTCSSCVETEKSDGNTCMWFDLDEPFCATGCGMMGCGVTTCDAVSRASNFP